MRRVLTWAAIACIVYFVIVQPVAAAGAVSSIGGMAADAANSVTTFFTKVVG